MEDQRLLLGYCEWIVIVALVLGLFNYFSKKNTNLISLLAVSFFPTWLISAIIKGFIELYFDKSYDFLSFTGFIGTMFEALPQLIFIGGITFVIKYFRFKKKQRFI